MLVWLCCRLSTNYYKEHLAQVKRDGHIIWHVAIMYIVWFILYGHHFQQ